MKRLKEYKGFDIYDSGVGYYLIMETGENDYEQTPFASVETAEKWIDNKTAHKHCRNNREGLSQSEICGCFHCCKIFKPSEIEEWCDDETTAICPHCTIDSVLSQKSGLPITLEFLEQMHKEWFLKEIRG